MRLGDREWRERVDREQRAFDRTFRWAFPSMLVLSMLFALAWLAVLAGGAAWLWSLLP